MGFLITTVCLVLPVLGLLYYYVRRKYCYWSDRNVTHVRGSLPMGSFNEMGSKKHFTEVLESVYQRFKKSHAAIGMYLGIRPILIVNDLDLVKQILIKDFNNFRDRGMFFNERDDPLSAHLFSIEGERWRFLRNKLSPTFTSGKIKYMFLTIREIGEEFLASFDRYVERKEPVDVSILAQQFTCDVIGSCAFGLQCNALKNESSHLLDIGDRMFNPKPLEMVWMLFLISFRDWAVKLGLKQTPADVTAYFVDVVQKTVDHREKNNVTRPDFLQLLMQLKNRGTIEDDEEDSKDTITMNEVIAQAFLFFFAGFETSSRALSFALFELAHNPAVQDKAREEVQRVIAAHDGHITYEAVKEMIYLEQIVNETLRKHAPIGNLIRVANEAFQIPTQDLTIEKETLVMIPIHSIHHDPEIYPDPSRFDPDRFSAEAVSARHSHSFLPFGDGPRMCIGMRFALVEVQFGIAQLLSRLRFSVNGRTQLPLRYDPKANVAKALGGLWLDAEKI
ncbi:probable cytochrome P450 6a14 [Ochlerotatus camptorhynchus]|uniref:probable cytochrome P450 6a14 n=1 Tax=Ochlerotatus camptorhynchus TaxID=644619 RepID=UPI0031DC4063